jgi:hypothetical protein
MEKHGLRKPEEGEEGTDEEHEAEEPGAVDPGGGRA